MTTAKRTTLVRLLHLEIGYERDSSPSVVASAILEALETTLIDEMGIVFIREGGSTDPPILTLYAPLDKVKTPPDDEGPPERPLLTGAGTEPKACPACGAGFHSHKPGYDVDAVLEVCDNCKEEERQPNVG